MLNKRYNSINTWLKENFGGRVYKVSLESGCSCPNRDGTIDTQGCIFCNLSSYNPATASNGRKELPSVTLQLEEGLDYVRKRHQADKVIAYFQRGSNTHAPASVLESIFREAASHPSVAGLAISTRPDCISEEHINLFRNLPKLLWVELGLQSAHNNTLTLINRGHNAEQFADTCRALAAASIPVCAHVILGLPHETPEMMIETAKFLNEQKVWGVKIHNLHVLKNTKLEGLYNAGKVAIPLLSTYVDWVIAFLEVLDPSIIIHRVNSHSPRDLTHAPEWSINKLEILNEMEKQMEKRNTWQGKSYKTTTIPDHENR